MDEKKLSEVFLNLTEAQFTFVGRLSQFDRVRLDAIYKLSNQLSDLCWQEIKRRKTGGSSNG